MGTQRRYAGTQKRCVPQRTPLILATAKSTQKRKATLERGAEVVYDSIGVGAASGSKFEEINAERKAADPYRVVVIQYSKFNAGEGVHEPDEVYELDILNEDFFSTLKAQAWWLTDSVIPTTR